MKVRHRETYHKLGLLAGDTLVMLAALHFGFWLRFESGWLPRPYGVPEFQVYVPVFGLVVLLLVVIFRGYGLYVEEKIASLSSETALILKSVTAGTLLVLAASFFVRETEFSRLFLPVAWVSVVGSVTVFRIAANALYVGYRRRRNKLKEVLVIGANRIAARYAVRQRRRARLCTRVVALLDSRYPRLAAYRGIPVIGRPEDIDRVLEANPHINEVLVAAPDFTHDRVVKILTSCDKNLVSFKWFPDFLGLVATQMSVRYESGMPLLGCRESPLTDWENRVLKRTMDVALSAAALTVLAPVFLAVAAAIALDSRGRIFYRQERVGEDGKLFTLYKFRTMRENAEAETGPVWAREQDSRRTRIGQFLRRTNLDELPQAWNVFKGDMSLVGPRPERPHFVGRFREDVPHYMGRHRIKSGITGWAQVNGLRGNTSIEERTKYDLFYIENWSIFLDLKILFMTPFAFKNAY